jgi:hypothetical protein
VSNRDQLLRDAENHHGRGVHDADEDPGEPDYRIGEVPPIIGKAPRSLSVEADHGSWRPGRCTDLPRTGR